MLELQGYLAGETRIPGVDATPGKGTNVPLYILGSSLFGAQLAAALGLPYAFASHFAPAMLEPAVAAYRREFKPSEQLDRAVRDRRRERDRRRHRRRRRRSSCGRRDGSAAVGLFGRGQALPTSRPTSCWPRAPAHHVDQMLTYAAVGTPAEVRDYLEDFAKLADADELIVAHQAPTTEGRLRSVTLTAEAMATPPSARAGAPAPLSRTQRGVSPTLRVGRAGDLLDRRP